MTGMLKLVAIAMAGGEVAWTGMSPEMRRAWLETAQRGLRALAERVQKLEAERDRFRLVLH